MAKSAPETNTAFDAVIRLADVAPLAPTNLRDAIYLGIRLTPEGDALDEIAWLIGRPSQAAKASVCARREPLLETIRQQLSSWFADTEIGKNFYQRLPEFLR